MIRRITYKLQSFPFPYLFLKEILFLLEKVSSYSLITLIELGSKIPEIASTADWFLTGSCNQRNKSHLYNFFQDFKVNPIIGPLVLKNPFQFYRPFMKHPVAYLPYVWTAVFLFHSTDVRSRPAIIRDPWNSIYSSATGICLFLLLFEHNRKNK